jgi:hypothetical protein
MPALKLTMGEREQLSDCRLLFAAAEHDIQVVVRGLSPDGAEALDHALEQAEQALAGLRRVHAAVAARSNRGAGGE